MDTKSPEEVTVAGTAIEGPPGHWKRIMWRKIRGTCPVCKKTCVSRYATLRHMRWTHALISPDARAPLKSPEKYAEQLRVMAAGMTRSRRRGVKRTSPPASPVPSIGSEIRWSRVLAPDKTTVNGAVHYCPNCGFELDRVTVRR